MSDEEDINIMKNTNIAYSDSLSALNENASTYMGVKTIPEGTIPDTNQEKKKYKKNKNNKKKSQKKYRKKNKKKYEKLDYSYSYSSSPYSSSISSSSSFYSSYSESKSSSKKKESLKDKTKNKKDKKVKNFKNKKNIENEKNEESEENEEEEENSKYELKIEETREKKNKKDKNEIIDTKFEWDEGGNIVYLTGSFCDWNKFHLMTKNDEGKYSITIPLPRGFHQYKFKVDDVWTFSKKQPKFEDNGNVNNFIDTTDYDEGHYLDEQKNEEICKNKAPHLSKENEPKEKSKKKTKDEIKNNKKEKNKDKEKSNKSNIKVKKDEGKKKNKRNSSTHDSHFLNQNQYSIYYPLRAEFNQKPSALPGLYKTYYILNEKKNKKKNQRKFSQIEYIDNTNNTIQDNKNESQTQSLNNSTFLSIDPYVNFQNLYHIHSNHFHSKKLNQKKNTITSIITRYRFKFSTFIYYKESKPQTETIKKLHSKTVRLKRGKKEK